MGLGKSDVFGRFLRRFATCGLCAVILCVAAIKPVRAQTPSPLAEWQYSSGIQLQRLFEPVVPTWQTELGLGTEFAPIYTGAGRYAAQPGPVVDIRYKDIAFVSTGEGIGANLFSFRHIRFGAAISYDLGRSPHADGKTLSGLGTIHPAPELKIFVDYTLAKAFPLDIRIDGRRQLGATNGYIGDVGAYLPMPGSSRKFAWFVGPTVTVVDNRYTTAYFGISKKQASQTVYKQYKATGGFESAGLGVTAVYFVNPHFIINVDGAFQRLLGSTADSPINQTKYEGVVSVAGLYKF